MRVFITGVSAGLGRGLAEEHMHRGDEVWGLSRRRPDDLIAAGLRHRSTDLSLLEACADELRDLFLIAGRFDLVWLNAGLLGPIRDLAETSLADLRSVVDLNLWANKVVIDAIFAAGPAPTWVVALSSGAAIRGNRGWGGYALSKAALNMLIQLEAAERPETRFLALAPGLVDTAMQEQMRSMPDDERFASLQRLKEAQGTANMPMPREAAGRILDLLPVLEGIESGRFTDIREHGS